MTEEEDRAAQETAANVNIVNQHFTEAVLTTKVCVKVQQETKTKSL